MRLRAVYLRLDAVGDLVRAAGRTTTGRFQMGFAGGLIGAAANYKAGRFKGNVMYCTNDSFRCQGPVTMLRIVPG